MRSRAIVLALALVLIPAALQAASQQASQSSPTGAETTRKVGSYLYLVTGGGMAHTAFYVTQKYVIGVDAKMTADGARHMLAEIAKVTPNPVSILILTHSDGDHVNGLAGFPKGLTILASEGAKREMEEAFRDERLAALRDYLPTQTHVTESQLRMPMPDGRPALVSLYHFGPAHTSGDTVILFHNEKAAFVGDLAFAGRDPVIHPSKGGTAVGYIETLKKMISLPAETYLSGHSDPLTKDDLRALLKSMEDKLAKVKELVAQGKSLAEVKVAFGIPEPAAGTGGRGWPSLVETIYLELTKKK